MPGIGGMTRESNAQRHQGFGLYLLGFTMSHSEGRWEGNWNRRGVGKTLSFFSRVNRPIPGTLVGVTPRYLFRVGWTE